MADCCMRLNGDYLHPWIFAAAMLCSLCFLPEIEAQEAVGTTTTSAPSLAPVTEVTTQSAPAPLNATPDSDLHESTDLTNEVSAEPRRFRYELKLSFRGVYDDNINISNTDRLSDYYYTFEPVLTLGVGDITGQENNFIRLDYAPSLFLFVHHTSNNAVQQIIRLAGQHRFSRLTLTLATEISIADGTDLRTLADQTFPGSHANLDVGGRTQFQTYNSRAGASYDLSGKTFLSAEFDSLITDYNSSSLFSSQILSENVFINYRYSDKVVVGIGGTGGYDFADDPNPDQSFEQVNARLSYELTGKLSVNLSGGIEFRQFEGSSQGQHISPVYQLSAIYRPSDSTNFTLTGTRQTFNSGVLAGQDFTETMIQASVRQRFLQRFYLAVAGGFQNSKYFSTISGVTANRQDDYYFIEPSLEFSVTRFWRIGGYYLRRQNDTSNSSFQFYDNQVGVRTALTF
jgi:Putative beta-barrel porin 2